MAILTLIPTSVVTTFLQMHHKLHADYDPMPMYPRVFIEFQLHSFHYQHAKHKGQYRHRIIIGVELVVLTIVGFIPAGTLNTLANILVSFTCAMQVEGFRKMDGKPFATTMCTGNLRSGTDNLFQYLKTKDKQKLGNAMQYYGIILCFIGGAAVGAFVTELLETKAVFVALTGLVIALCILRSDDDKLAEGK